MTTLLLSLLFGLFFGYFAIQNTTGVGLQLFAYRFSGVPLYLIAFGALLVGSMIAWFLSMFETMSSIVRLRGKESQLLTQNRRVEELVRKIDELQVENRKLKDENKLIQTQKEQPIEENHEHEEKTRPNILDRLRHNLSF